MKAHLYPPTFLKVKLSVRHLWLPLFLLWPIYLFILLLAYSFATLLMILTWRVVAFRVIHLFHVIFCNLRGLTLEVKTGKRQIDVQII